MEWAAPKWSFGTDDDKYNTLEPRLQDLLRETNFKYSDDTYRYVKTCEGLLKRLQKKMTAEDTLFEHLFKEVHYSGSYYEGLKIDKANEFDLNLILEFPSDCFQVTEDSPGHVSLNIERAALAKLARRPGFSSIGDWISKRGNVLRSKVKQWMQSVVDLAINALEDDDDDSIWDYVQHVSRSESGPAITLHVETTDGLSFSVDLVPVLRFPITKAPVNVQLRVLESGVSRWPSSQLWYAVPKAPPGSTDIVWRVSLPQLEKDLIRDMGSFKPMVRMIKRLRDCQEWNSLASYFILNAYMWMIRDPEDAEPFQRSLGQLLMKAMRVLRRMLNDGRIPFFWDPEQNLLETGGIDLDECQNIASRLRRIIDDFEDSVTYDDDIYPMEYFDMA